MAQVTPFDFVLLLIIGEATQQALLGDDFSIINAGVVIITLISLDIALSLLKQRSKKLALITEGTPTMLIENGKVISDSLSNERVDKEDILEKARELQGIEDIKEIKHAILERSGGITIIPYKRNVKR